MTLRVLALSSLPTIGPGNRLRVEQYVPLLKRWDIDLEVVPFFDDQAYRVLYQPGHTARKVGAVIAGARRRLVDLWRAREYELLFVYRESMPLGPPLVEVLWNKRRRPYVFDFDDAIFLGPMHPVNRRWSWLRHSSRVTRAVRGASAVIAGNEYLAQWARELNGDVTVLPTPVDTARHLPRAAHAASTTFVVGWVGSNTTAPYLRLLDDALAELGRRRDVIVRIVGGEYAHPSVRVEKRSYKVESEPADLESFDVGVLPQPDDPWTRGKGAFKAVLYMATALPVVASHGRVNADVVTDGETGYCVTRTEEWVAVLDRLAGDPAFRQRLGDAGRRRVEEHYSLLVLAPRLAEVLRRAAGRRT